jgi:uncharacterized protein YggL (DUF469 family)
MYLNPRHFVVREGAATGRQSRRMRKKLQLDEKFPTLSGESIRFD